MKPTKIHGDGTVELTNGTFQIPKVSQLLTSFNSEAIGGNINIKSSDLKN